MKSVFGNVLIGKKVLVVPALAKKPDFLKIKISACLEGSLINTGKNNSTLKNTIILSICMYAGFILSS